MTPEKQRRTMTQQHKMKSAEEWAKNHFFGIITLDGAVSLVEQIQLDAFKAGMLAAAEIVDKKGYPHDPFDDQIKQYNEGCHDCKDAILSTMQTLTKILG